MPELERPDGARIAWRARGEGPPIVMAMQFLGGGEVFPGLIADLSTDHRVITYDLRGTGESSRDAQIDYDLDVEDLAAVVEIAGPPVVIVCAGDGTNRAVRAATRYASLVTAVVTPGGNPVARVAGEGTEALVASQSVLDALAGMIETDYRGAVHAITSSGNVQMSADEIKQRVQYTVAYCPHDVAVKRMRMWIDDRAGDEARALGDRLWMLEHGTNPWFPIELVPRSRELLPDAHIEIVEDGPLSRPDITAGVVRGLTGVRQPEASQSVD